MSYYLSGILGLNENYYDSQYDIDSKTSKFSYAYTDRRYIIQIIQDFLNSNDFEHYYRRWYCENGSKLNKKDQVSKIYNPYGYMSKIMTELVLLSPILNNFNTSNPKKLKALRKSLEQMDWDTLSSEVTETQELKGDFFAYWYYEQSPIFKKGWREIKTEDGSIYENQIPRIKVLESENMRNIVMDNNNIPTAYRYVESFMDEKLDDATGTISRRSYTVETIFRRGYIRVNDPHNYKDTGYRVFLNKEWERDIIRLIHIPSFKKQKDKFSRIPATEYIDPIQILNALTSDLRLINKLSAFPVAWKYDTDVDYDASSIMPGGQVECQTTDRALNENKQGFVKFQEITNNLQTLQDEQGLVDSVLYKKIGLIREKLEEKLGSSDSSRVISQLRLLLENKFEKYSRNKAKGFAPYFKSVLYSTGNYTKTDEKNEKVYTFEMPDLFINTSIFDNLSIINSKLALGLTTMIEEWEKQGLTQEEQEKRMENINREILMKNKDIRVQKNVINTANNGQGSEGVKLDNQMKQDTNIEV